MNISPKDGPNVLDVARPGSQHKGLKDNERKARAMAALMGAGAGQANASPVADQSNITPSEQVGLNTLTSKASEPELSGQTATIEASSAPVAPVETKAAEPEANPLSQHYAILARKERALRAKVAAQEQSLRDKEAAFKAQEDALKAREAEYSEKYIPKDRFTNDPLSVLNESGITYEQLTEMLLNPGQQQGNQELKKYQAKVEQELKALRDEQQKSIKAQEEAKTQQYQQALNQIHFDVKAEIESNPDFEMVKETGSSRDVVSLIEKVYKKEGHILPVAEACRLVEEDLMIEAEKIFKIKKLSNKFQPAASAQAPVVKSEELQKQPQAMKTLTNAVSATRKMSARERAVLAMQGKLPR